MSSVYLALGSNVGDSRKYIAQAIKELGQSVKAITSAPIYVSKAVGYTNQPDFINTVISGQTELTPEQLLKFIKHTEQKIGRTKTFRWGPREIDIDIIFYDDIVLKSPLLTIPHPYFKERDFVLIPLSELDSDLIDPLSGKKVVELLAELKEEQRSIKSVDEKT